MPTKHAEPIPAGERRRPPMELLLQCLPAQQREIIAATYFGGRTTREAARVLGLAPEAVTAGLYQAMRDLSQMVAICSPDHAGTRMEHLLTENHGKRP
jgi:DNA-directed RNA polymerase specialized sigma24 family protein